MARFLNLCFEVPEDLEEFDNCELFNRNGSYFLRCYYFNNNYSDISLSSVHCSSGDMIYIVNHMLHFFNGIDSTVNKAYDIWLNGVLNYPYFGDDYVQKKDEKKLVSEKFPKRSRRKKSKLG